MLKTFLIGILTVMMGTAAMAQTVEDLMQADRDFSAMAQTGEVRDAFLAYAANTAVMLNGGSPIFEGEGTVHEYVGGWPDGIRLSWEPVNGMMAESGELGFTYGRYISRGTDAEGNETESHGKYVTIWHRQDDGTWKFILDGGNPSPSPEELSED